MNRLKHLGWSIDQLGLVVANFVLKPFLRYGRIAHRMLQFSAFFCVLYYARIQSPWGIIWIYNYWTTHKDIQNAYKAWDSKNSQLIINEIGYRHHGWRVWWVVTSIFSLLFLVFNPTLNELLGSIFIVSFTTIYYALLHNNKRKTLRESAKERLDPLVDRIRDALPGLVPSPA